MVFINHSIHSLAYISYLPETFTPTPHEQALPTQHGGTLQAPHSLAFNWPRRDSTERIFNLVPLQKHWFTLPAGFRFPLQVCVTDSKTKKGYVINYLTSAWLRRQRICYASLLLFRFCQDSKLCVSLSCLHSCFIFPHMVWQISTTDYYGWASVWGDCPTEADSWSPWRATVFFPGTKSGCYWGRYIKKKKKTLST